MASFTEHTGTAQPSRAIRIAGVLFMLAASSLTGLLLVEAGLRLFWPQIFPVHPPGMYTENGYSVPGLTPNFEGRLRRTEFDAPFSVNSSGFRGPELRQRNANTVRILALGDSQTFGFGVTDEETYTAQLERRLTRAHPGLDVQVINTGTPGYGTYSQLELLRARWEELDPNLVLLQFLPVNDFEENRDAIAMMQPQVRNGMLTSVAPGAGETQPPVWLRAVYWSKARFHLVRLAGDRLGYLMMRLGIARNMHALWGEDFSAGDARLTQDLLEQVAATVQSGGARMLFVYSTAKHDLMGPEYVVPRSRAVVERAAANSRVDWLDLNELMRKDARPHRYYFVQDGHWSPAGHEAIARILADELENRGLLPAAGR